MFYPIAARCAPRSGPTFPVAEVDTSKRAVGSAATSRFLFLAEDLADDMVYRL